MNSSSIFAEAAVLTQVNKWVGVVIAFVGAIVAAPDGAQLIYKTSTAWTRRQINRLRKPSRQSVKVSGGAASMRLTGIAGTVTGRVWSPNDPIDQRIEVLRAHIGDVEVRLNHAVDSIKQEQNAREVAIAELNRAFQQELGKLHELLEEKDRRLATVDARGLPVIGFGVLLSGVPEALADIPLHLGWALPFAGFAWMVVAVLESVRSHRMQKHLASTD
ncbi:hypothetical protein GCM10022419_106010 [Nonomuraea rosea]|uniref:DUF4349 domain-containing protein n=1 Tax=Nonomuraea rosea TaxID=638574 RepID=A0ABP6ZF44_9ACTN